METGNEVCLGRPQTGKTHLALLNVFDRSRRSRWPVIILDFVGARNFAPYGPALSHDAALKKAIVDRDSTVLFHADNPEMAERFLAALVRAAKSHPSRGRWHLLIDEAHNFCSAHYLSDALSEMMRAHAHLLLTLTLTTQSFGDLHRDVLAQNPTLFIFQNTDPGALKRLESRCNLSQETITSLPPRKFIRFSY